MISTTIDMIRHGEPVGGRKYRGQIDDPLSEKGWRQMREAVGDDCPWDAIVSSPLLRCRAFAAELAKQNAIALAYDARLKEIGFGEWEGKTAKTLMDEDPDILMRFWSDPLNNTPPGAETLVEFQNRIITVWHSILDEYAGRHILIVGHAGQMRMVIRHVLEMPLDRMFRIQVPNAGVTRIRVDGQGDEALPRLMFHGQSL
ncbi:histidine phosphatase family protein [Thiohalomonas denitrificans]|uniref:histidine phosphatase family protein n=1 Tax=Thiohalomonas denitrificans TaxID=415747 RepID=UPI0026EFBAA2|nr:alpha-ribazole phosphatase family protein [Thiohalomonas denitrificans]